MNRIVPKSHRVLGSLACALAFAVATATASPPSSSLPENSVYQLDAAWKNDDGRTVHLADLAGKPRVLTMFFSRCDNICPMLTGQLKMIEREMPASLRAQTGFVLVTLDTESDDAETLTEYRTRMGYSKANWTLLRAAADDTRELANILGVTYMPKDDDGQIDHNGLIVILDAKGRVVEKYNGITDRKAFIEALKKTAANR